MHLDLSWKQSFFWMDFSVDLGAFLVGFGVQLELQNRQKNDKNRCQDALDLGHCLRIPFGCDFGTNLDPAGPNNCWFFIMFVYFLKNDLCKLASISSLIWVPTWLHFRPQNRPKSVPTWVPRAIQILNDFWIVFCSFLVPFLDPKCTHVGPKLAPNLATGPPLSDHWSLWSLSKTLLGFKRVLGSPGGQEVLQESPGVQKWL